MITKTATTAKSLTKPTQKPKTTHSHSLSNDPSSQRRNAHLCITIRWAGAAWPAPGRSIAFVDLASGVLIFLGGSKC